VGDRETEEPRRGARYAAATAAGLCVVAAVLVVGLPRLGSDRAAPPPKQTTSSPPLAGAWAEGGRPDRSPAVERALADRLPAFVIALNQWLDRRGAAGTTAALDEAAAALGAPAITRALGPEAASSLETVLAAARDAAAATGDDLDGAADALTMAVLRFNDALASAGLGYVIDNDVLSGVGSRVVLLFSFEVERVRPYRSGEHVVRSLHLARMDRLNWSYNLLGFTTAERREALVLLDEVEDRVVDRLLPQLGAEPTPYFRLEDGDEAAPWAAALQARAAEVVRGEYGGSDAVARLGDLVARRKRLMLGWNLRLAEHGWSVDLPDALHLPFDVRGELGELVPDRELDEYDHLAAALRDPALEAAFTRARDLLATSIDRHEVQHRLDHLRSAPLPMPAALDDFVGPVRGDDGEERPFATRARAELSAYLAELARDPDTAGVGLLVIAQFLIEPLHWGTAESYTAAVILEGLIAETGIGGPPGVVRGGEVDRARVTEVVLALTDLPRPTLREAAAALWARLFESPLPPLAPAR
jgi:hypothetical protein